MAFFTVVRDLLRYNREFLIGFVFLSIIIIYSLLSFFSPVDPLDTYVVWPDIAPSAELWFGTTSRGKDLFWLLRLAFRNTLVFGIMVSGMSRVISITVCLVSGYVGGLTDRILMIINDVFVTLPIFPLLLVIYFIVGNALNTYTLAIMMALLGWPFDARLIRSITLSLIHI